MRSTTSKRARSLSTALTFLVGALGLAALLPTRATGGDAPFTARLGGSAAFTGPASVEFQGTGTATHLGRITGAGVALLGSPSEPCPGGALGIPNVHTETLTASDGDQLVIEMVNVGCPTGPFTFHGTGQWRALSGTGRFESVTGHGVNEGNADFETNTFELVLTGTLARP
jgi:hypothetical protein